MSESTKPIRASLEALQAINSHRQHSAESWATCLDRLLAARADSDFQLTRANRRLHGRLGRWQAAFWGSCSAGIILALLLAGKIKWG